MDTSRVETFSDGVFAVAITLLVLTISVPDPATTRSLLTALADQWPQFAAVAISFTVIGIVWVNHHAIFRSISRADRALLFINLGLLLSVVMIPFTTALFARYLTRGGEASHIAGAIFSGALLLMALAFSAVYLWVVRHPALLETRAPVKQSAWSVLRFGVGTFAYAICIPVAFISAEAVMVIVALVAAYYIVDQITVEERAEAIGGKNQHPLN